MTFLVYIQRSRCSHATESRSDANSMSLPDSHAGTKSIQLVGSSQMRFALENDASNATVSVSNKLSWAAGAGVRGAVSMVTAPLPREERTLSASSPNETEAPTIPTPVLEAVRRPELLTLGSAMLPSPARREAFAMSANRLRRTRPVRSRRRWRSHGHRLDHRAPVEPAMTHCPRQG